MNQAQIYILSGKQGEGKTTRCLEIVNQLKSKGERVGGFVAPGFWENNVRSEFDLMDIQSGQKFPFAKRKQEKDWLKIKSFYFNPETIKVGEAILRKAVLGSDWIVLDEIGKLDIQGYVWSTIFSELISIMDKKWIICVRDIFVDEVITHWQLQNVKLFHIKDDFVF